MTSHELAFKLLAKPNVEIVVPNPSKYNTMENIEYCISMYDDNGETLSTLLLRGSSYSEEIQSSSNTALAKENILKGSII